MSPAAVSSASAAWADVRRRLREMDAAFDRDGLTALVLAKNFAALAQAFLQAMEADGQTSSRFRAVVKALDLKTPSSQLARFLAQAED